jgi:hypothetical protein
MEAIQRIADLMHVHEVMPKAEAMAALGMEGAQLLETKKVALLVDGSWALPYLWQAQGGIGIAVLPKMTRPGTDMQAHLVTIVKDTENPNAAWELIRFLSSPWYQERYCRAGLWLPSQTALMTDEAIQRWCVEPEHPAGYELIVTEYTPEYGHYLTMPVGYVKGVDSTLQPVFDQIFAGSAQAVDVLPAAVAEVNQIIPRYGVVDRNYGGPDHDGFQDILNSSVNGYLEWGLFHIAKRYLENYFNTFVRADGSLLYRGPEISQYARTLTNLAQYVEYTGDDELLMHFDHKIKAIVRILMVRREAAKQRDPADPAYGLISGRHEADISFVTPTLATLDYEQPYFCNSTEAWRGFRDLGRVWTAMGERHNDPELLARGRALLDEAAGLEIDIHRAIERSILTDRDLPYLPLIAGSKQYHIDAPYRSRPESFDENRVWSEMMHSGVVRQETIQTILDYCAAHRGATLGIFTNRKRVVAFQCYGEAYGLIQHDMIPDFLLFFYAHATHLHARGTWTAYECVDMDRDRGEHAPYCAPAQMTIPAITKWMLVFEDPLSATLWLAKATPRTWLAHGERIHVKNAPTRWGPVSYTLLSALDTGAIHASIVLSKQVEAGVKLRLRAPKPHTMQAVTLNHSPWTDYDPVAETITLPGDATRPLELEIRYA